MKKLLLFTLLLSVTLSWGQQAGVSLDQNTTKFISNLENRGISSYFTTDRTCDAQTPKLKTKQACETKESYLARYVFWKENGVTMVKLIDNCGMFTSYALNDTALADYSALHAKDIKANELKPYAKESNNDSPIRRAGPNNCRRTFMFKSKGGAFVKKYNMFDLSSQATSKNINKVHNNSLPIAKLDQMIDGAIKKMEANTGWSRM